MSYKEGSDIGHSSPLRSEDFINETIRTDYDQAGKK